MDDAPRWADRPDRVGSTLDDSEASEHRQQAERDHGGASTILSGQKAASDNAAIAAKNSAAATAAMLATNREIERAYISMTHQNVKLKGPLNPVGGMDLTAPNAISFTIKIRNTGKTPGDLLGGYFGYHVGSELGQLDLLRSQRLGTRAFILPGKSVDFGWEISALKDSLLAEAFNGTKKLWLIGAVDYRDRFGNCHQHGYGRRLSEDRQHFLFAAETGPLNYDKPCQNTCTRHTNWKSRKG